MEILNTNWNDSHTWQIYEFDLHTNTLNTLSFVHFLRGCFDEFNRISVEVLSVVAVQVKSVQDAIRDKKEIFNFMGEMIRCVPSVGIFITMVI